MEIKNTQVYGLKESIKRSAYPMSIGDVKEFYNLDLTEQDIKRISKLGSCKTGAGHDNFCKGIIVQFDIKYPQYFSPQIQRYNWIHIISSQSKMHKLATNKLNDENCNKWVFLQTKNLLNGLIKLYNDGRFEYPKHFDVESATYLNEEMWSFENKEELFMAIVSNLPMGYEMWMGLSTNYLQLKTIYQQRRFHKLEEWQYFCDWIETLPMFKEICLSKEAK